MVYRKICFCIGVPMRKNETPIGDVHCFRGKQNINVKILNNLFFNKIKYLLSNLFLFLFLHEQNMECLLFVC